MLIIRRSDLPAYMGDYTQMPAELSILDDGIALLDRDWAARDVCSPFSRLYFVIAGEGFVRCGEKVTRLQPGFCYCLPSGLRFDYGCEDHMKKLYFHVSVPLPNGHDILSFCPKLLRVPWPTQQTEQMVRRYTDLTPSSQLCLMSSLYDALSLLMAQFPLPQELLRPNSPEVSRVFSYVQRHLSARVTIAELAADTGLSVSALSKRFRAETGLPIGRYIDGILARKARQLLLSPDLSIGEIAHSLGFCDQFYFSRFFSRHCGEAPSAYRRRLRGLT